MKKALIIIFITIISVLIISYGQFRLDENKNVIAPIEDFKAICFIVFGAFLPFIILSVINLPN